MNYAFVVCYYIYIIYNNNRTHTIHNTTRKCDMRPDGRRLEGRRPGGRAARWNAARRDAARRDAARRDAARRMRLGGMYSLPVSTSAFRKSTLPTVWSDPNKMGRSFKFKFTGLLGARFVVLLWGPLRLEIINDKISWKIHEGSYEDPSSIFVLVVFLSTILACSYDYI